MKNGQKKSVVFTMTNNTFTDQRMQRIAGTIQNAGYTVLMIGHNRGDGLMHKVTHDIPHRLITTFFQKGALFYAEYNLRLLISLIQHKSNIIYAVDLDTIFAGKLASIAKKSSLIFDSHEYFTETPELINRPLIKLIWKCIAAISIRNIDLCITVNEWLADLLKKEYNHRFEVIRNFPYKNPPSKRTQSKCPLLIYQGAINKGRGLELIIDTMDQLDKFHLLLIGNGDIKEEIKRRIYKSRSKDRIKLIDAISPSKLKTYTSKAMIGLNLLDGKSKSYFYSLANKFFDYIQAGVPSINMEFPVYQAYLKKYKTGEMISQLDEGMLAAKIKYMTRSENYLTYTNQIELAAREYIWEKESKKLIQLVDNI